MMSEGARERALSYLAEHQVMTLATTGDEGVWAAAVFYVNNGFDLIYLSAPHTRHARNTAVHPRVAATIQEDYVDWGEIKGIQCEGEAAALSGAARKRAIALYREKFSFLTRIPLSIQEALQHVNWYRLRPDRLYFVDNSRGFGHRDEIKLG